MRRLGYSRQATLPELESAADRLAADASVQAVVLWVDSPGGEVAGTSAVAEAVWRLRQVKPVVAYVPAKMGSCAYWIGSQARSVVVDTTAVVGAIGTYWAVEDQSGLYERMGVKMRVVRDGQYKGLAHPGTEVTAEQLEEVQRLVSGSAGPFRAAVRGAGGWRCRRWRRWRRASSMWGRGRCRRVWRTGWVGLRMRWRWWGLGLGGQTLEVF